MTSIGNEAGEILDNGVKRFAEADFGSFTAQSLVFTGGTVEEDFSSRTYRVGTYATPILPDDLVKVKTGVDDTVINVERMAASDNGSLLWGIFLKWRGKAGDTVHDCLVYKPRDGDVLVFEAGTNVGTINVGDSVSFDSDSFDRDEYPHGLRVVADNTDGFGYVLNQVDTAGDTVKVEWRSGA